MVLHGKDRGSLFISSLLADQDVVIPPIPGYWGHLYIPALDSHFPDLRRVKNAYFRKNGIAEFKVGLPVSYGFYPVFTYEDRDGSLGGKTFLLDLGNIDFQVRKGVVKQTIHVPLAWSTLAEKVRRAAAKGKKESPH